MSREVYVDNAELGFQINTPKSWDLIPAQPNEVNQIVRFAPHMNSWVNYGGGRLALSIYLVRFDRAPKGDDVEGSDDLVDEDEREETERQEIARLRTFGANNIDEYMRVYFGKFASDQHGGDYQYDQDRYPAELSSIKGVEARTYLFEGVLEPGNPDSAPTNLFVAEFDINEQTTIALIGPGPGGSKWRAYEKAYSKMAKSLRRVEVVDVLAEARAAPDADTPRGKKRIELTMEVAKSGDWKLYSTDNYFVVSASDDQDFLDEMMMRLEAIREVYEVDYPAEKARVAGPAITGVEAAAKVEPKPDGPSARELSRTSVVRVCQSRKEYGEYGGPPGSAGYWSSRDQELVIFDDKARGGRSNTWITLNHEAFHQYIFYFYGSISPHSWYNEGTGDYYSGYQLKNNKFRLKENSWRKSTVKEMIRDGKYVPLREIVRWTQSQYYGSNDLKIAGGECYAQGWGFIYFLRTGKDNARGWQDSWDGILETYLDTLARTSDLDKAVDAAFDGVDWAALEEAWKEYIG